MKSNDKIIDFQNINNDLFKKNEKYFFYNLGFLIVWSKFYFLFYNFKIIKAILILSL